MEMYCDGGGEGAHSGGGERSQNETVVRHK